MADSISASVQIKHSSTFTKDGGLRDFEDPLSIQTRVSMTTGTGAGQVDAHFGKKGSVAASATETLDLRGSAADEFGNVLSFQKIKAVTIKNLASPTSDAVLKIKPAASSAWVNLLESGSSLRLRPGASLTLVCDAADAAGYGVSSGTDQIELTNESSTTAAPYDLIIDGVKP